MTHKDKSSASGDVLIQGNKTWLHGGRAGRHDINISKSVITIKVGYHNVVLNRAAFRLYIYMLTSQVNEAILRERYTRSRIGKTSLMLWLLIEHHCIMHVSETPAYTCRWQNTASKCRKSRKMLQDSLATNRISYCIVSGTQLAVQVSCLGQTKPWVNHVQYGISFMRH